MRCAACVYCRYHAKLNHGAHYCENPESDMHRFIVWPEKESEGCDKGAATETAS